ncbi:hypothetical protein PINS_up005513 [Pythium insidiosum]|nr:hypothetical protein PINS_up005513 [Pythium insidiosum]
MAALAAVAEHAHEQELAHEDNAASERQFRIAEAELLAVLEADDLSEHVRKRALTRLFDRFRDEYTQLSLRFREALRTQRKIMEKVTLFFFFSR